jgi:serine O-acetyltransferase
LNQFVCHVDIDPDAIIGTNFLMPHPSGIVIGGTAIIGNNCIMMQNSTIGTRNLGDVGKRHATLGDDVFVGPNVVILGNITIGKNARIGAGSVVLADVNENQTIIGVYSGIGKLLE